MTASHKCAVPHRMALSVSELRAIFCPGGTGRWTSSAVSLAGMVDAESYLDLNPIRRAKSICFLWKPSATGTTVMFR